ncbi:MAG: RNA polymerase sigma factor [Candidatus Gracilibacteria bacterium]|nr:RNA polymerase sigma factor [Candidatus Gracilibacteria bacterium]
MRPDLYQHFQSYYKKYLEKIYNYLFYRTGYDKATTEDLCSAVFLKALENFESFDENKSSFQSWIYAIAHNHLIDFYRAKKETVQLEAVENSLGETPDLAQKMDRENETEVIMQAIQVLPDNYRELLTLKYVQELSNTEICEITGKSAVSVRVTLHRALSALKEKLL